MHACYEIIRLDDKGDEIGRCKLCGRIKNYTQLKSKSKRRDPIIVAGDLLKIYGGTGHGGHLVQGRHELQYQIMGVKL